MQFPELDSSIEVAPGLDVDDLWSRFEVFEALHYGLTIDNPMSSQNLDDVVALLDPRNGDTAVDLACGHGELLRRLASRAAIVSRGVDLSPWMLQAALQLSERQANDIRWVLDDAKLHGADERFSIATCLGASWIWLGLPGTVREVAARTEAGGRIAVGDMHLRAGLDPTAVRASHGTVASTSQLEAYFDEHGVEILGRVNTSDDEWDEYLLRTTESVERWAQLHPGPRAEEYLEVNESWKADQARDREILTWSVWVGRKR